MALRSSTVYQTVEGVGRFHQRRRPGAAAAWFTCPVREKSRRRPTHLTRLTRRGPRTTFVFRFRFIDEVGQTHRSFEVSEAVS